MRTINVLLADDHSMVRDGLRNLLELESDVHVVETASNGRDAVSLALRLRPDVVIMDLAMPGLNGIEALKQLRASAPTLRVLVLTAHRDDEYLMHAIANGVWGFVLKQDSGQVLVSAVRAVAAGKRYFSNAIAWRMLRAVDRGDVIDMTRKLSLRETEVLQLLAEGVPPKEIAGALSISVKTVAKHRQQLMLKLDLHSIDELTRYALAKRIVGKGGQIQGQ